MTRQTDTLKKTRSIKFNLDNWCETNRTFLTTRLFTEGKKEIEDHRPEFERDRCRIIHSQAFRRLQGKSQIFAPVWTDHLFTRISHSTQVAQIGKALALRFGAKEVGTLSLVESACLAHDLGHPPFGHVGESALHDMMKEHGGFEGNAQTFRIVSQLEKRDNGQTLGLNLCRGTLLSVIKYPYFRDREEGKFLYKEDLQTRIADECLEDWLLEDTKFSFSKTGTEHRTIICSIMDWADDVAYSVHDLQDGIEGYFLHPQFIGHKQIIKKVQGCLEEQRKNIGEKQVEQVLKELARTLENCGPNREYKSYTRAFASYINDFVTRVNVKHTGKKFPFDYKLDTTEVRSKCDILKAVTRALVVNDVRTTTFAAKGRRVVEGLFEILMKNADSTIFPPSGSNTAKGVERSYRPSLFREHIRQELQLIKNEPKAGKAKTKQRARCARIVCDYIASLTDGQAISLYGRLTDPKEGNPLTLGL